MNGLTSSFLQSLLVKRLQENDSTLANTDNYNPLHDTALYEFESPSGLTEKIQANIITENMFAQVDSEGHHQQITHGTIPPSSQILA